MIPAIRRFGGPGRDTPQPEPAGRGVRRILGELFPAPAEAPARARGSRPLSIALQVAAVVLGTVLLLLRVPGPSWTTIYGEDYWKWLVQSLQQPWHLFIAYNGYWQFLPRLITQLALYLPLTQASWVLAVSGALVATCCGLFVFHASAGHIRSAPLRALLGASFVLLSSAPMEIADSAVNTVWYLQPALFWAVLWRPRTRGGMTVSAVLAFVTAASNVMVILFAPLLAARWYVLRRPREHAVTAGWLAGCAVQVPFVVSAYLSSQSRLGRQPAPLGLSVAFYGHDVVLPSLGWHLAWWLQSLAGRNGATAIMAVALAVIFGVILVTQPATRPFVVTALLTGFILTVFGVTLTEHVAKETVTPAYEAAARYTALPILLIEAAAIVAVDYAVRRRRGDHRRADLAPRRADLAPRRAGLAPRPAMAVAALVAVLAAGWIADFRYAGIRSDKSWSWGPIVAKWQYDCAHSRTGEIVEQTAALMSTLPCANIRP
jgi:hypothetical protein